MNRLSVSLDDDSFAILKKYHTKYPTSQAEIIRKALRTFDAIENATERISVDYITTYIDLLADSEHLIVDIAQWKLMFLEITDGSKKFWENVYKLGALQQKKYYDKGLREVKEALTYFEKTNWYRLKEDSKNSYTLIMTVAESSRFIKTFFEGFFSKFPQKIQLSEEVMKIRVNIL